MSEGDVASDEQLLRDMRIVLEGMERSTAYALQRDGYPKPLWAEFKLQWPEDPVEDVKKDRPAYTVSRMQYQPIDPEKITPLLEKYDENLKLKALSQGMKDIIRETF